MTFTSENGMRVLFNSCYIFLWDFITVAGEITILCWFSYKWQLLFEALVHKFLSHLNQCKNVTFPGSAIFSMTLLAVCCYCHQQYGSFASLKIEKKRQAQHLVFSPFSFIWRTVQKWTLDLSTSWASHVAMEIASLHRKKQFPLKCISFHPSANTSLITSIF